MAVRCHKHESFDYTVTLIYVNGDDTTWEPMTNKSLKDFITILGNDDEETGQIVFDNILKKTYYESNK